MPNTKQANLPHLDGWRGLAILAVFVGHFTIHFHLSWIAEMGVRLFFVLSGYFMADLLFIKGVEFAPFFQRRLSRILPAFLVYVVAMVAYSYAHDAQERPGLQEILSTLVFLRTYIPPDVSIWAAAWPIGHLWSLNVEEHSYIYLAIVAAATRAVDRARVTAFLLFGTVAIILACVFYYRLHAPDGASPWYIRSECAALGLMASASLRLARTSNAGFSFGRLDYWVTICCLILATFCYARYPHKGVQYWVAPLALAIGINFLDRAPQVVRTFLAMRWLRWFGTCSFSLYLWQQPFYMAVENNHLTEWVAICLSLFAGTVSFYLVESPARAWINEKGWGHRPEPTVRAM